MKLKRLFFLALFTSTIVTVVAQIPKNTWREHLPFNNGKQVAIAGNRIYCATDYALFYFNKDDNSLNKLTKINKLSDMGIGSIAYHKNTGSLVIGYNNGNLDVIVDDSKYNFPDIKNKNIIANKSIYHINIHNEYAYLSTGFGIVVFDMVKKEFVDTYLVGDMGGYLKINTTEIYNDTIFALTDSGVLRGGLSNQFLANYQSWEADNSIIAENNEHYSAAVFNNKLYMSNKLKNTDTCLLTSYDGYRWKFEADTFINIKSLSVSNNNLLICSRWHVDGYNSDMERIKHFSAANVQHAMYDQNNELWFADAEEGLVHNPGTWHKEIIYPAGPASNKVFELTYNSGGILVAPGAYRATGEGVYNKAEVYHFHDEKWTNITNDDPVINPLRAVVSFATTSNKDHYFAGTWGFGFFEVKDGNVTTYDSTETDGVFDYKPESNLMDADISGLTFDEKQNLWMVRRNSNEPFVVKTPGNDWYSYSYGGKMSNKAIGKMIQTRNNDFWTVSYRGDGIFVWNTNGTAETASDDVNKWFLLEDEYGSVISGEMHEVVEDKEGTIWIGTSDGIAVYDYPRNVLSGNNFYARRPQLVVDGYLKPLLEGEKVTAIAVDGGNRKWIGTETGGLFLVSPDGTEQILVYNTDNSPLFSNSITALEFNKKTGELFIGTSFGLLSYMTTSSGNEQTFSDIYTFPNPVPPGYNGFITIRGLVYESDVKITDLSGNVVYETISNGGDAIWNGKDLEGRTVSSGIYLVMVANNDGTAAEVSKILFMK